MIGRVYYAPFDSIAFGGTGDRNFFEIQAPADRQVILHSFSVTSVKGITAAELAKVVLKRFSTDGTGTAVTEVKANQDNSLAPESTVVSAATPGTAADILCAWAWSQQGELLFMPTPEMRPVTAAGANAIGLNLVTALAGGASTWSGWVCWEEV